MDPHQPPDDRDFDNPYAPPQSAFVREPSPALVAGTPVTIADVFNWSWAIFKERMGTCLRITWGVVGINWAISLGMNLMISALTATVRDRTFFALLYILTLFIAIVIQVWLVWVGQTIAMIKIARGEPVNFGDVFTGGPHVLTLILASIVFFLLLVVPILIAVVVSTLGFLIMGDQTLGGIMLFLFVSTLAGLFFIYISSRLAMYYYLVIDQNAGVFASLQRSWHLCRNQVGTIVLAYVLQVAIVLAGMLAFCVGLIWAIPLANLLLPVTYLALTGTRPGQPGKPDFVWEEDL